MKYFTRKPEKNETLQQDRNISFEIIMTGIEDGRLLRYFGTS